MAGFCGFHGVSVVKNLLGKASRQSTSLCFRYESHGGHRAHEQARIETKATNGSGRKASLYEGLGVRHRTFHEIDGACHSLTAARNSKPLIHGNSTWNVEEPYLFTPSGHWRGSPPFEKSNSSMVQFDSIFGVKLPDHKNRQTSALGQ